MKRYNVYAVVQGESVKIKKQFKSRIDAIDYMIRYYSNHSVFNFEIEEEHEITKHRIEYYENNYNRFIVDRVIA